MKTFKLNFTQEELDKFKKENFTRISTFRDLLDSYVEYAPTIRKKRIKLGYPSLDNYLRITPTDNILINSKTSGKKTTLLRNVILANEQLLKDEIILVFSLELLESDEAELYLSMLLDIPTEEIEKKFAMEDPEIIKKAYDIWGKYENIITITDTIDVSQIIPFVLYIEYLTKKRVGLIVLDYAQLIEDAQFPDEFKAMAAIPKKIKKINIKLKKNFIVVSQVGRESAKDKEGISLYSSKGSGNFENSFQIVLSLEMPDPQDIRKDKSTGKEIYPFGEHQAEICKLIDQDHRLDFHILHIRKKKKYYLGVKKPTCIIKYSNTNLRMVEWVSEQHKLSAEPF